MNAPRAGVTLVEIVIVLAVAILLAAVVIPQSRTSRETARQNAAEFNLSLLRCALQSYQAQHSNAVPVINSESRVIEGLLAGAASPSGNDAGRTTSRYLKKFPLNPYTQVRTVRSTSKNVVTIHDVTAGNAGGWLYNETTGQIWLDSQPGFDL